MTTKERQLEILSQSRFLISEAWHRLDSVGDSPAVRTELKERIKRMCRRHYAYARKIGVHHCLSPIELDFAKSQEESK